MPLYEYRCQQCNRRFSHLHGVVAEPPALECPRCHSTDLKRLISRFSRVRSEEDRLDALDPSRFGDIEDPKNMQQWARKLGKEMGDEMGDDFAESLDEALEADAHGEDLDAGGDAAASAMPDVAASDGVL